MIDKLQNKIRELVPELVHLPKHDGDTGYFVPIHLEHVVQSIIAKKHETKSAVFYVLIEEISCLYKYNKPFTNQSPELYEFLSDILIKE